MKILILGSNGLVGSSLYRRLRKNKEYEVIGSTRNDANLFSSTATKNHIENSNPEVLINCAAKVGGIYANNKLRTEFLLENLKININVLEACIQNPNIFIINLGSSCIYPLNADNPITEESIMSGPLEPTNSPYAMAKLTAIELANSINQQFGNQILNLMPTILYGPGDNFSEFDSHVIPGLIYRLDKAKLRNDKYFKIWGTGSPLREFLFVDDLSSAVEFLIKSPPNENILNVGSGEEISISSVAKKIKEVVDFKGELIFDDSMPDGNPGKLLDYFKTFDLGWKPEIDLNQGLTKTYKWFKNNIA